MAKKQNKRSRSQSYDSDQRTYTIPDYRLEKPSFTVRQVRKDGKVVYEVTGDLSAPVPPIRESKYLNKKQSIEIYRWMLLNRKMEIALENLYKQGKVVGGVYFGLGQEACSCASAYALRKEDWLGPMIRNQGSILVRGFSPRDIMMQYMAKAGSPTRAATRTSHFGDIKERNMVSPISMLGDLIPVLAGVALGARLQGRNIAVMTYIGDGGQSTGVTYEGLNFAAVQDLGLVLFVESNLWAYSTPADMQFRVKDLAERAIGLWHSRRDRRRHRRLPGLRRRPRSLRTRPPRRRPHSDRSQNDAHERPRHPRRRRLCPQTAVRVSGASAIRITRFENYLVNVKKWLTPTENRELIADVDQQLEADREFAVASPDARAGIRRRWRVLRKRLPRDQAEVCDAESSRKGPAASFKRPEAAVHLK